MPLDDTNWNYGDDGVPQQSGLSLSGVYKLQAQGPADYCAAGTWDGQEILIPERSLLRALEIEGLVDRDTVTVDQADRPGKNYPQLLLTVKEAKRALAHIDGIAPDSRHVKNEGPDPMGAVA